MQSTMKPVSFYILAATWVYMFVWKVLSPYKTDVKNFSVFTQLIYDN